MFAFLFVFSMYAETLQQRLHNVNLMTELVVLRGDSTAIVVQKAVQDACQREVLFACVINEQNALHRSLTVNILHGQQQGKSLSEFASVTLWLVFTELMMIMDVEQLDPPCLPFLKNK